MANTAVTRVITVDSRGRTSLARIGTKLHDRYLVDVHEDGRIVLTPAVTVSLVTLQAQAGAAGPEPATGASGA